jgi:DNA replication protein DnaC
MVALRAAGGRLRRCYDSGVPDPIADPDCPRCEGRGWVRVADGGAGSAVPCTCRAPRVVPALVAASGIPAKFAGCNFETFRTEGRGEEAGRLLAARRQCEVYVEEFLSLDGERSERGLLLMGPPGVGKTHLAVSVLRRLTELYRVRGKFLDFSAFLARIQASFDPSSEESKQRLLDPVLNAELLVFDDLGAQKPSPFVMDILYLIVNTRYGSRLPTIFTTNFRLKRERETRGAAREELASPQPWDLSVRPASDVDLLAERLSPRLVSRLCEMARPVMVHGVDFRKAMVGLRE